MYVSILKTIFLYSAIYESLFCIKWILMFVFFYPFSSEVLNTDSEEPFLMFSV